MFRNATVLSLELSLILIKLSPENERKEQKKYYALTNWGLIPLSNTCCQVSRYTFQVVRRNRWSLPKFSCLNDFSGGQGGFEKIAKI